MNLWSISECHPYGGDYPFCLAYWSDGSAEAVEAYRQAWIREGGDELPRYSISRIDTRHLPEQDTPHAEWRDDPLRDAGWIYECDRTCAHCGLAEMDKAYPVCSECHGCVSCNGPICEHCDLCKGCGCKCDEEDVAR